MTFTNESFKDIVSIVLIDGYGRQEVFNAHNTGWMDMDGEYWNQSSLIPYLNGQNPDVEINLI